MAKKPKPAAADADEIVIIPRPSMKSVSDNLAKYRVFVGRVAAGVDVQGKEMDELLSVVRSLEIPEHAFDRDVAAALRWQTACQRRRKELLLNHPHLFGEVAPWVRSWLNKRVR